MEVRDVTRAAVRKSHFVSNERVILFLTLVVHNSVVYAVLYVTRKMFGIICTFFVALRDIHENILKETQNVMNNVN